MTALRSKHLKGGRQRHLVRSEGRVRDLVASFGHKASWPSSCFVESGSRRVDGGPQPDKAAGYSFRGCLSATAVTLRPPQPA